MKKAVQPKKLKTAKMHVACVEFLCPYCEENISNGDNFAHTWLPENIHTWETLECDTCGEHSDFPTNAIKFKVGKL